jgi:twinkle protein
MSNLIAGPMVIVGSDQHAAAAKQAGAPFAYAVNPAVGPEQIMRGDFVLPRLASFDAYIIALPAGCEQLRDDLAMRIGDERCKHTTWRDDKEAIEILQAASLMWNDEIATLDDIPEPGPEQTYTTGFDKLDEHGLRLTLPAFVPLIGPYGSGKSVFLRQLLINLWQLHGWRFLITSFEERVKPRYIRDFRRHLLARPVDEWTVRDEVFADIEIRKAARFLRRKRGTTLDADRLLGLIEFAVRVHGVRVVAIDPVNEIDHHVPAGMSRTDYMGRFIMRLKALADDYGLLIIVCAHPPKDGAEKRLSKGSILTLNDGADTAHWGNKADIGFVMWRPNVGFGPTILNIDKVKDHESMGRPTLAELVLDKATGKFRVTRTGFDVIGKADHARC